MTEGPGGTARGATCSSTTDRLPRRGKEMVGRVRERMPDAKMRLKGLSAGGRYTDRNIILATRLRPASPPAQNAEACGIQQNAEELYGSLGGLLP
jgi:hypothetical protein